MARKYNIENLIGNLSDKENFVEFVEPEKVPNLYPDDTRVDISGDAKEQSILDIDIGFRGRTTVFHFTAAMALIEIGRASCRERV